MPDRDRVSPRQAAERLTDLAYALAAGGPLELSSGGERLRLALGDELRMRHDVSADGERVQLALRLSWSTHRSTTHEEDDTMPDERAIAEELRDRLAGDARLPHAAQIAVSERAGSVVLRGTVRSLHQRRVAVAIARSVPGVRTVDDELRLDPRDHWDDAELRGTLLQALIADARVPDERLEAEVTARWATLTGTVGRQADSDAAFDVASHVTGLGGITNRIQVVTGSSRARDDLSPTAARG
jgi:amphi-Trp domain-containing protein